MSMRTNKIIHINNEHIFGATTLKDITLPEKNNTALHVCINPEATRAEVYLILKQQV